MIMTVQRESICILGATGSIGTNTLDVIRRHPERYRVFALTANQNIDLLFKQCVEFEPEYAVLTSSEHAEIGRAHV